MTYKEYPDHTKPFIVVRCSGFGVMEAPYVEHEVVFECDNKETAELKAKQLKQLNNTPEEIKSSWVPNTYHININTACEEGKRLVEEFRSGFDKMAESVMNNYTYDVKVHNGITYYFKKMYNEGPALEFVSSGFITPLKNKNINIKTPIKMENEQAKQAKSPTISSVVEQCYHQIGDEFRIYHLIDRVQSIFNRHGRRPLGQTIQRQFRMLRVKGSLNYDIKKGVYYKLFKCAKCGNWVMPVEYDRESQKCSLCTANIGG